ncbi:MAG: ABC transporter permease [Bacteroidales bacterium]|nr:ABC transporter permease [Bacteroidales bacterium]
MLKNYFVIAWRNLLKNKVFSLINILGLAVGISVFLVTMLYVFFERSYDKQYHNANRLFRVSIDGYEEGQLIWQDAESYFASGPDIRNKYPEVADYARIFQYYPGYVKIDNRKYEPDRIYLAEPSFLKYFEVKIIKGDTGNLLVEPNTVILSRSTADKYFGTTSVEGKTLYIDDRLYTITGIFADSPANSHIHFDMLISLETGYSLRKDVFSNKYSNNSMQTYLVLHESKDYDAVMQKIYNDTTIIPWNNEHHLLQPVSDIHLHSHKPYEAETNGSARVVNFLFIIGFISAIIAWLNYINLTTARALERAREVGIRKISGSTTGKLISQFVIESLIVNLLAILVAVTLLQLCVPFLTKLLQNRWVFTFQNLIAVLPFILTVLAGGMMLSGLYPAFVLSRIKPAEVIKHVQKTSQGRFLRMALTVFQFTAATVLIAATLVIFKQNRYMMEYDTGFTMDNIIAFPFPVSAESDGDSISMASFYNEIKKYSFVADYCAANTLPGTGAFDLNSNTGVHRVGDDDNPGNILYYQTYIDDRFIDLLKVRLVAGRNFSASMSSDTKGILINQLACSLLGFHSPAEAIGKIVDMGGDQYFEVIGVVKDFYYYSLKSPVYPIILNYNPGMDQARYIALKINHGDLSKDNLKVLEEAYKRFFPEEIFSSFILQDTYYQQYNLDRLFQQATLLFSAIAIFIACMGLFGISVLDLTSRTKEAGIRKSVGATGLSIAGLFVRNNLIIIGISLLISLPLSLHIMQKWLDGFPVRIDVGWWFYVIPILSVIVIALSAISMNMFQIARTDPAISLRYE